jgi:hypothetical protein
MPHQELPPQNSVQGLNKSNEQSRETLMAHQELPPQKVALYAAGGGFGGALLAIVIARVLAGPCCCPHEAPENDRRQPAAVSAVLETVADRIRPA